MAQYTPKHPDPEDTEMKARKIGARFSPPLLWRFWGIIKYHHNGKPAEFVRAAFAHYADHLKGQEIPYIVDNTVYTKPVGEEFPEHRETFSPGRY